MQQQYTELKRNVSLLGELLGTTIAHSQGTEVLEKVELIRHLAKSSRSGDVQARETLIETLQSLPDEELLPVCRAFSHFLNLANVAEQQHTISDAGCPQGPFDTLQTTLSEVTAKVTKGDTDLQTVTSVIENLSIELVLTAHPTEVTRRTLISKHVELSECLSELADCQDSSLCRTEVISRIEQLICQAWHTNEIRNKRPTPLEEAKWGFAVIENSLWDAVPKFTRTLTHLAEGQLGISLPEDYAPVSLASWMGGDRDGNPNVTAEVTQSVLDHGRWMALDLYYRDLDVLSSELSMAPANEELRKLTGEHAEPYRALLKQLKADVNETILALEHKIKSLPSSHQDKIRSTEQLMAPLTVCYRSLTECGMEVVANGMLLDVMHRLRCFGVQLCKLDIRQDSGRHCDVLSEVTRYLGLGDYAQWSEQDKQAFLLSELSSRRPLLPKHWQPSEEVQEVLDTFAVIAKQDRAALGIYIISMAREASDVLAVELLLQESGCPFKLPVAPLFETLDDLNHAQVVMQQLFDSSWYKGHVGQQQYVMIGYSDSAKDAGMMAAGWAQYLAMEQLIDVGEKYQVEMHLFHGRGGTIGRGGAPAAQALRSQPPGSLSHGLRVTEQGEMIRFKFGLTPVAIQSLSLYASAIIENNLYPPPQPKSDWRDAMALLSEQSCKQYRDFVRGNADFVSYFRAATPEIELAKLPLGSRPAKRKPQGGIESLRAIPWIFAWSQNRLMLPAWLGALAGIQSVVKEHGESLLGEMSEQWPFFRTRLEMLEMVFCKTDLWLSEYYDARLVPAPLQPLGKLLRSELKEATQFIEKYAPKGSLLSAQPWIRESIALRNPYTDPLNVLQVELLKRTRDKANPDLDSALMITMMGIAAGIRNTG
ncbi:phosphoenolpyruvate carboxylase [Pseudoalteromonas rubra]|uniref:Phosphoenolpyruvate carboxylase n=1 Tax=Pseudoalteromonas rubra TaxID=43658 RepID=A0A5S3WUM2_9GAMM|nr:phosphoenolpyruvate carboxylase [Pseudoalteromonas rubra]TMP31791.1 phosphoenolpyruvate carboxylase [Pseudoalteromonas rubra]TMP33126.1 phosphoenolpyruvate carboxylase [Pseudoalteromonas rubra]